MDIDKLLSQVEKPSRYTGGEWNAVKKQVTMDMTRVAFCFADLYEVGMSHLGLRILYDAINKLDCAYCERVFAPWVDMEELMRKEDVPLFTVETRSPVGEYDIVAFTLQYEMSFTNILNMLDLAHIPLFSKERKEWDYPLVVAGGPSASNPEPLSSFIDLYLLGDGEESVPDLVQTYNRARKEGRTKQEFLEEMAGKRGIYVPSFYDIQKENDKIKAIVPTNPAAKPVVESCRIENIDGADFPTDCIVPNMGIVHDRITLEIMRGCTRGCRFCQAGYLYRPIRERSLQTLTQQAEKMVKNTGYDEISLSSLSSSDHSQISELTQNLIAKFEEKKVSVALPSLRLDGFSNEMIKSLPSVRKTGLTFAPEAGSQRLRDVINKNVTEEDLKTTVRTAFELGWKTIKLYFMIGLPTETMEDVQGIVNMGELVAQEYEKVNGKRKGLTITISTSTFVPKSHTPFQWFGQEEMESIYKKQEFLKGALKARWFKYNWHDPRISMLESCFARGGREMGAVLYEAFCNGCRFDSWADHFSFDGWTRAFADLGLDAQRIASRTYEDDEILPWDMISYGVTKQFLCKEKELAQQAKTIPDCREGCAGCGLMEVCL